MLLAACGGGDSPTPTATTVVQPTSTPDNGSGDSPTPTGTPDGNSSDVAQSGDTVLVHYHGTLDDGSVFDSSLGREPLRFTVGGGQVIAGFDAAVDGLAVGEKVTARIEPADAYGELNDALIFELPRSDAPTNLLIGAQVQLTNDAGSPFNAVVTGLNATTITLDANHTLAVQALTFEVELVEIVRE